MTTTDLVIEIPWPRWPTMTSTGRISKSKKAGRRVPWLNANTVNNLHRRTHQAVKILWRHEARDAALEQVDVAVARALPTPCRVDIKLFAPAKRGRDVSGIIEGVKPLIDGLVLAGVLADDRPQFVSGFDVEETEIVGRKGNAGVRLTLR